MKNNSNHRLKKAVALHYNQDEQDAPRVKASGSGLVADQILHLAQEHQIPILEDPSLVEILAKLEINQQIPVELYDVIAEILAMVYQLEKRSISNEKKEKGTR